MCLTTPGRELWSGAPNIVQSHEIITEYTLICAVYFRGEKILYMFK